MHDKDYMLMLKYLFPICNKLTLVEAPIKKTAKVNQICSTAQKVGFKNIIISKNIPNAISQIQKEATIICGSFYIMEEVINNLKFNNLFNNI
jgi:folylpolyglutamate synthase/dihydropteroate synthase